MFNQLIVTSYNFSFSIEDYNILPIYVSTLLVFLIFYNVDIENNFIKKTFIYLSTISLDIYLASSLIDKLFYPLCSRILKFNSIGQQRIVFYAPIILIIVFLLSTLYGTVRKKLINVR